jgi:hypothetical protein
MLWAALAAPGEAAARQLLLTRLRRDAADLNGLPHNKPTVRSRCALDDAPVLNVRASMMDMPALLQGTSCVGTMVKALRTHVVHVLLAASGA